MPNDVTLQVGAQLDPNVLSQLQRSFSQLEKNIKFSGPFGAFNRDVSNFNNQMDRANQRVITLGASFLVLSSATKILRDIVTATVQVEKSLVDINAVFRLSTESLNKFSRDLFDVARSTSQSFEKAAEAAKEFSRQGLTAQQVITRTRDALVLTRQSGLDVADAVKTITSALNGFQKEALTSSRIVGTLANLDVQFAVSSKDLADALTRVGSSAADVGISFNQLVGLVTTAKQVTGRDGAVIAGALNTIFTRINRTSTLDQLESLGVEIKNVRGEAIPTLRILQNFADVYDTLGTRAKVQAAEIVGGVRNLNTLKAILGDVSRSNGIFAQTQEVAAENSDAARRRNEELQKSLAALGQQFATTAQQIGANIGKFGFTEKANSALKFLVDNPITKAFANAGDDPSVNTAGERVAAGFIKGFGNAVISALGPLIVVALGGIIKSTFSKIGADFSEITGLNRQAKEQQAIQSQIVALYSAGDDALKRQILSMGTLVERAAALERILSAGTASSSYVAQEIAALSSATYGIKKSTPRAAEGFIPFSAESAAISAGVGGAPLSARPVLIPNFNFGKGIRGPIVANSSEYVVPNFANGGAAIFNQDMVKKYGLPRGAQPIAAGGYIPNAADGGLFTRPDFISKGSFISTSEVDSLNKLFKSIREAGSGDEARRLGKQVIDLTMGMNKLAQSDVLGKLGKEFTAFDKGLNLKAVRGRIIDDNSRRLKYPNPSAAFGYDTFMAGGDFGRSENNPVPSYGALLSEFGPAQPPILRSRPGLFSRIKSNPMAGIGLGFGLSFLGGLVPEGRGGTASGIALGGLGSGLTLAGTGGSIGSLFGPAGSFAGAGAGLAIGGAYGALKKLEGSFAEFAQQVDDTTKKMGEQSTAITQAIELEDQIRTARASGASSDQIRELRTQQAEIVSGISNSTIRNNLVTGLTGNDLSGLRTQLLTPLNTQARNYQRGTSFLGGILQAQDSSTLFGAFGYNSREKQYASDAVATGISKLSSSQVKALQSLAAQDPVAAMNSLGKVLGLNEEQKKSLAGRTGLFGSIANATNFRNSTGGIESAIPFIGTPLSLIRRGINYFSGNANKNTTQLYLDSINTAAKDFKDKGLGDLVNQLENASNAGKSAAENLEDFVAGLQSSAKYTEISLDRTNRIRQIRNQAYLSSGLVTDADKIAVAGGLQISTAQFQGEAAKINTLNQGRIELAQVLSKNGGLARDNPLIRESIQGLGSLQDVISLKSQLETVSGKKGYEGVYGKDFREIIEKLIGNLQTLDATQTANIDVIKEQTRVAQEQYEKEGTRSGQLGLNNAALSNSSTRLARLLRNGGSFADVTQEKLTNTALYYRSQFLGGALTENQADIAAGSKSEEITLEKKVRDNQILLEVAKTRHYEEDKINQILMEQLDLIQQQGLASGALSESAARLNRVVGAESLVRSNPFSTGSQVEAAGFAVAKERGIQGDYSGSFSKGFSSRFDGIKRDIRDLSDVGAGVAKSLETNLGNAFGDFITGSKSAKEAFRSFAVSVLEETARMFASKAVASIIGLFLSALPVASVGGGTASASSSTPYFDSSIGAPSVYLTPGKAAGGIIGMASGGSVPAMVMGGEYYVGANAARRIGYRTLNAINSYAGGGLIMGGSGVRDDIRTNLERGGFVIRKSAVNRVGVGQLDSMVNGGAPLNFADGGGVDYAGGANSNVNVQISINNNNVQSSSGSQSSSGKGFGPDFALRLEKQVRSMVQEELINQSKADGFLTQRSRYVS